MGIRLLKYFDTKIIAFIFVAFLHQSANCQTHYPDKFNAAIQPLPVPYKVLATELSFVRNGKKYYPYSQSRLKERTFFWPAALLRYGLFKKVELRTGLTYKTRVTKSINYNDKFSALTSPMLGIKARFLKQKRALPTASLNLEYDFFSFDYLHQDSVHTLTIRALFENLIAERWKLRYNFGLAISPINKGNQEHSYALELERKFGETWAAQVDVNGFIFRRYGPNNLVGASIYKQFGEHFVLGAFYSVSIVKNPYNPDGYNSVGGLRLSYGFNLAGNQ